MFLKLIKKYDSQARLMSYKMSMIKDFLGEDLLKKTGEKYNIYIIRFARN